MRLWLAFALAIGVNIMAPAQERATGEAGPKIGNIQLQETSGATISLQSYSGKVIVLIFWSFKCPVSLAYIDRIEALQRKYRPQGVVFFGVASSTNETPAEIRANLSNLPFSLPVMLDSEGKLADMLGATHTPEVFVLDREGVVRYRGALDNNKRVGEKGRIAYTENALDSILAGTQVMLSETKPFGCVIKRRK